MKLNFKQIVSWILVFIWVCVIFGFSTQDGSTSGGLSGKIVEIILNIFNIEYSENIFSTLQFVVRKLAHATEYCILGILVFNAFYNTFDNIKRITIISFIFCVAYSATDEVHQLFIPDRVGSIKDCIIDSTGALIGILICISFLCIINKISLKTLFKRDNN